MTIASTAPPVRGTTATRSENLCRHYRMGETLIRAVDGVSLEVRAGEFAALLGSSGSGKSSVLNLIAGLDRPTSGSVVVGDRDLASLSREDLAKYRLRVVGLSASRKSTAASGRALLVKLWSAWASAPV